VNDSPKRNFGLSFFNQYYPKNSPIACAVSFLLVLKMKEIVDFMVIDKFESFFTFLCFLLHFL